MTELRRHAPATQRNKDFILEVLNTILPASGNVLEIASGTGQHVAYFASKLEQLHWFPTDLDSDALPQLIVGENLTNVAQAQKLDVREPWPVKAADALININMIHISPWESCLSLFEGASKVLSPDAILYLYGPFKRSGQHTAPSNESFDISLRSNNSSWGVRDIDDVTSVAIQNGFQLDRIVEMPANNLSVIFRKGA